MALGGRRILLSWSGGKDSTMALRQLREGYDIVALLTTVTQGYDRISMHGVPRVLLERQAAALGLPLEEVWIPPSCTNREYEERMEEVLRRYLRQGVETVAFGDILLEDLRRYREEKLAQVGLEGIFPLWKRPTLELAREFIRLGFRATICCVDSQALPGSFAGREFDGGFLAELPPSVDPCGERGEFHSFVHCGPLFAWPVRFTKGPDRPPGGTLLLLRPNPRGPRVDVLGGGISRRRALSQIHDPREYPYKAAKATP